MTTGNETASDLDGLLPTSDANGRCKRDGVPDLRNHGRVNDSIFGTTCTVWRCVRGHRVELGNNQGISQKYRFSC